MAIYNIVGDSQTKRDLHNQVGNIFWLVIAGYVTIHAWQLGLGSFRQPGLGLIFFLSGLLLVVLSVINLAVSFIEKPQKDKDSKESAIWAGLRWQKVLLIIGGLSAYVFLFDILGFIPSTFLLMVFLFKAVEPTKWWTAILSSLITIVLSYLIFKIWLEVQLPTGFLGF